MTAAETIAAAAKLLDEEYRQELEDADEDDLEAATDLEEMLARAFWRAGHESPNGGQPDMRRD